MHIVIHIVLFYIHLILALTPYLLSGVAVYLYFLYKEEQNYNATVESYMSQFGVDRETAIERLTYPLF